jgi:hypothetical protein
MYLQLTLRYMRNIIAKFLKIISFIPTIPFFPGLWLLLFPVGPAGPALAPLVTVSRVTVQKTVKSESGD